MPGGCPDPVLPRVCMTVRRGPCGCRQRTGSGVAAQTAAHSARLLVSGGNHPSSDDPVEALFLYSAGHPPAFRRAHERVDIPDPAEQHLLFLAAEDHRVETYGPRRRGVAVDPNVEIAEHVRVRGEIRQHLGQPGLDLRVLAPDPAKRAVVDVGAGREHAVKGIEAPPSDRRRVVDQQLLDFEPVRDLLQAQHGSIEHDRGPPLGSPPMAFASSPNRSPAFGSSLGRSSLRKVLASVAILLAAAFSMPAAHADSELQPPGRAVIPAGPAPAWIVADMDTGQVLAGRDVDVRHPPASTIKVLLALVALDEISLDSTIVANQADTQVECNCVGIKPGRSYTARELLDAVLLASGNDAANTLADMVGGFDAVGAGRSGWHRLDHTARPRDHFPRGAGQPGVRADHFAAVGDVPRRHRPHPDR